MKISALTHCSKKMLKFFVKVLIIIAILLILVRVLFETEYVKNYALTEVNKFIEKELQVKINADSFELGYFPPAFHAYNVNIKSIYQTPTQENSDSGKDILLKTNRISVFPSYLKALWMNFKIGEIQLVSPFLHINKLENHIRKLSAQQKNKKDEQLLWPISIAAPLDSVRVFQAQLYYKTGGWEYTASNVNTVLQLKSIHNLHLFGSVHGINIPVSYTHLTLPTIYSV